MVFTPAPSPSPSPQMEMVSCSCNASTGGVMFLKAKCLKFDPLPTPRLWFTSPFTSPALTVVNGSKPSSLHSRPSQTPPLTESILIHESLPFVAMNLGRIPTPLFCNETRSFSSPNLKWAVRCYHKFPVFVPTRSAHDRLPLLPNSVRTVASDFSSAGVSHNPKREKLEIIEENIEKVIYGCRFFAILAVWGSLIGSFLCFFKGCVYVISSFQEYLLDRGKMISSLVEATDVYLLGTVMLVFGMGLYELFISNLDKAKSMPDGSISYRSNLFGLFTLKERPRWLEIKTVNELKTKLGHVIVMLLLIGFFDKSKRAVIQSPVDLLCFSASVLLCSGCLFLLSKLND
ncbi:hypothetical protein C2S52_008494 [Perilla frutescens var. hirtella]|nr:hypothetical protein C2S52_008494 [Perilla frutescens var. hirtella]